jgi:hypothetical protein
MNTRRVVVPDLGDTVIEVVSDLTEMLIALVDETLENELPSVLADGFGLEALDRIWVVIKPTQERTPRGCSPLSGEPSISGFPWSNSTPRISRPWVRRSERWVLDC